MKFGVFIHQTVKPYEEDIRENVTALRRVLVSFDVHHRRRTETTLVHRFVFGREVTMKVGGREKRYRYPGLIHRPGVERLGQSVLILREKDAEEFTTFLAKLRVPFHREKVWVEG